MPGTHEIPCHTINLTKLDPRCKQVGKSKKSHFLALLFVYVRLFTLPQKKANRNCCTAALAIYLLLLNASYYLHSHSTDLGHATGGVHVLIWSCWGLRQRIFATWTEFQHSVVYATDQCRKRLEACNNAESGHSEHLLWHCLPDILVATRHNGFFLEPLTTTHNWLSSEPPTFERTQQTFSQMKNFCNSQVIVVTFSGWVASGLQFVFLWDNINNQKYVWIILSKWPFLYFPR